MKIIRKISGAAVTAVFPRHCPVCDRPVRPFDRLICDGCRDKVTYIKSPYCMKCGKELRSDEKEYCHDCAAHNHSYDRGRAVFEYRSIAHSLYGFKYSGRREFAAYYGERTAALIGAQIRAWHPDALIPVPIHASRKRVRGYNQAEVFAKAVGSILNIPVLSDWISRCRKTVPQKELGPAERQNNLKKAFKIIRNDVKLSTIVIIDDIYTTGSTMDAVADCARAAGVQKVYFVALAIGKGM